MLTTKDFRLLKVAKKMMVHANHNKYSIAALLVRGNRIISIGLNSSGPPPHFLSYPERRGRHAEAMCLLNQDKKEAKNCVIYVAGQSKHGNVILTKPCPWCYNFIRDMGVKRVVYHTVEDEIKEEIIS